MTLALALPILHGNQSALDPAGPQSARIGDLTWLLIGISAVVQAIVMVYLLWGLFRRRSAVAPGQPEHAVDPARERRMTRVITGATIATAAVLFGILIASVRTGAALSSTPADFVDI